MTAQKGYKQRVIDAYKKAFVAANGEEIGKTLEIIPLHGNDVVINYKGISVDIPTKVNVQTMHDFMTPYLLRRAERKLFNELDNWGDYKIQ